MLIRPGIEVPDAQLASLCARFHVAQLLVFGSSARGDFGTDSDVDLLVEFQPDAPIGLIGFAALRRELSTLMLASVDLVSKRGLNATIKGRVLQEARELYAA